MGRLPNVNFQPVIQPYVKPPIETLGETVGSIRQDYEEGIAIDDRSRQAIAAARASAPKDQEVLDRYNQELISTLDQARESGDYERQRSTLKKALSSYTGRVTPIMERNQMFDNFAQQAIQTGSDPSRVLKAMYNEEAKNPTLVEQDGYVFNRLRPTDAAKFIAPNVNLTEEFGNISKLAQEEIRNSISTGQMTAKMSPEGDYTFPVMINGKEQYVSESKVRPLIESRMNETDIQRYLDAERNLLMSGEDLSREEADAKLKQRLDEATNSVVGATTYRNITKNVSQINVPQSSEGGGAGSNGIKDAIISKFDSRASLVSTPEAYIDTINKEKAARESGDVEYAEDLKNLRTHIDNKLMQSGKVSEDEAKVYNAFSNYDEPKLRRLLDVFATGQTGVTNPEQIKEFNKLQNTLESLNLSKNINLQGTDESSILGILNKVKSSISKEIDNVPELSASYTSYSGFRDGLGKGTIGAVQESLNRQIDGANVSLVKNYSKDNSIQLRDYIDKKYTDFETDNGDITYNRLEAYPTDGIGIDGNPLNEVVVYGKTDDGEERKLGVELFTKGDNGWTDYVNTAKGLMETGIPEDIQQGQLMIMKAHPVGNQRIGQYIAKKNLKYIPESGKIINFAGLKGKVYNGDNSKYKFVTDDGQSVPFNSENELVMEMYLQSNKK